MSGSGSVVLSHRPGEVLERALEAPGAPAPAPEQPALLPELEPANRRLGRPPGARNRGARELEAYLETQAAHPVLALAAVTKGLQDDWQAKVIEMATFLQVGRKEALELLLNINERIADRTVPKLAQLQLAPGDGEAGGGGSAAQHLAAVMAASAAAGAAAVAAFGGAEPPDGSSGALRNPMEIQGVSEHVPDDVP